MLALGVDPGTIRLGWGLVERDGTRIRHVAHGVVALEAEAPLAEVQRYATDLRSITQGRGTFEMKFDHYEELTTHLAQKVIAEAQKTAAAAGH